METILNPETVAYISEVKTLTDKLITLVDSAAANPEWELDTFNDWLQLKESAIVSAEQVKNLVERAATL